ncbi:hypothetical protein SEUCBS139899_003348 [Sporothrix eucalyptigena]
MASQGLVFKTFASTFLDCTGGRLGPQQEPPVPTVCQLDGKSTTTATTFRGPSSTRQHTTTHDNDWFMGGSVGNHSPLDFDHRGCCRLVLEKLVRAAEGLHTASDQDSDEYHQHPRSTVINRWC